MKKWIKFKMPKAVSKNTYLGRRFKGFVMIKIMLGCLVWFCSGIQCNRISNSTGDIDSGKKQLILAAIQEELRLHPKATLLDLYKNFFQGSFGPGHLISDLKAATDYLTEELEQATEFDTVLWQPVGYERLYYRVNLSLVRDGKVSFQDLVACFVASANTAQLPPLDSWRKEWKLILDVIEKMDLALPNFEKDKLQLNENLAKGILVGHHSASYTTAYFPHYRIVSQACFEKLFSLANKKSK